MVRKLGVAAHSRGIRNNNPFNIRKTSQSWKGKIKHGSDPDFEQFQNIWYGLRAGFLLLRNGYLMKGFDTVERIMYRFAPCSENDTASYVNWIFIEFPALKPDTKITTGSLSFFWLCQAICRYESQYDLSYENYNYIINRFKLW